MTAGGDRSSRHHEDELPGALGVRIYWQRWLPAEDPRAAVVLAHGAGEHSGRYAHVAKRLAESGYAVYALDHRGHGRSQGRRALIDRMDRAVADLHSLIERAAAEQPGVRLFLLGHSMGGAIALRYAMHHQDQLDGLVLSGPLAALEAASPPVRMISKVLSAVTPSLPVFAVDATLVSRDPAVVSAYETDPLVHHGKLPARTVAELAGAVESFPEGVAAITIPTLIMYGTADQLCPTAGSLMLAERIGAAEKTVKSYDGLYHEILNEPEQERVLDDLCTWLDAQLAVPAGRSARSSGPSPEGQSS